MTKKESMTKKKIAEDFLNLTEKGEVEKAFKQYIADDFKHHNPRFKGDREAMKVAMEKTAKQFSQLKSKRYAVLEDGNLVSIHSHIRPLGVPEDRGMTHIHIFRFDGDKIVELWDFGQMVPAKMTNENGMF